MDLGWAGLIGIGQVACFLFTSIVHVRRGTGKSELHVWLLLGLREISSLTNCTALSIDSMLAQPSIDHAAPSLNWFGQTGLIGKLHVLSLLQLSVSAVGRVKVNYMPACRKA